MDKYIRSCKNAQKNTEWLKFQGVNICPNILYVDADGIAISLLH